MADLIMRLKGFAVFNKLLSLVRGPFELANLYHLSTDLSDGLDGTRTQIFDMLDELLKRDESATFLVETLLLTMPSLLMRTTELSLKRLVQIQNRSSAYVCVISNNRHNHRLACLLR